MKRGLYRLLIVIFVILSMGGACQSEKPVSDEDSYRVLMTASAPPFSFLNKEGNITGFDIDLMNAIAEKSGFNFTYENIEGLNLFKDMENCQQNTIYLSAISPVTFGEKTQCFYSYYYYFSSYNVGELVSQGERCTTTQVPVYFSDPYFTSGSVVVVRTDNNDISSYEDLAGKKVAVSVMTIDHRSPPYSDMDILLLEEDTALQALFDKKVDALITELVTAISYVNQFDEPMKIVGKPFTSDRPFAIGVCDRQGDNKLINAINIALKELRADGKLDELEAKWLSSQK